MLTFKEDTHQYFWDGAEVPGVNHILKTIGQSKDWSGVDTFYRDRGTAVHKAITLWIKGILDETSLDPVVKPYFDQFVEWAESGQKGGLWLTEQPYYSPSMKFAGTIDLICNQVIYDVKCSKKLDKASEWQYQLAGAGYRTLVRENLKHDYPFKLLLLPGVGKAQEIPLFSPYAAWEHTLSLYDIKMGR